MALAGKQRVTPLLLRFAGLGDRERRLFEKGLSMQQAVMLKGRLYEKGGYMKWAVIRNGRLCEKDGYIKWAVVHNGVSWGRG